MFNGIDVLDQARRVSEPAMARTKERLQANGQINPSNVLASSLPTANVVEITFDLGEEIDCRWSHARSRQLGKHFNTLLVSLPKAGTFHAVGCKHVSFKLG